MSKRSSPGDGDSESGGTSASSYQVPKRTRLISVEPVRLPAISTVSDLDVKVLVFQNHKLSERLCQRRRIETDLRNRCEQLELRQARTDTVLCTINRHWNRLDEDLRILLQRLDVEGSQDISSESTVADTDSFLTQLSHWDKEELDEQLAGRVEFSRRAVTQLLSALERYVKEKETISSVLNDFFKSNKSSEENNDVQLQSIKETIVDFNQALQKENSRLQNLATSLQLKNRSCDLKRAEAEEQFTMQSTQIDELKSKVEDMEYEIEKGHMREEQLEWKMSEICNQLKAAQSTPATVTENADKSPEASGVSKERFEELQMDLHEQTELAKSRLTELREIQDRLKESLLTVESFRKQAEHIPDEVVKSTAEYQRLQTQFTLLYGESMQMQRRAESFRTQLVALKTAHQKQIEQMENDEMLAQNQLRGEMIQLEDQLSQVRREYEMLRVEFEQNLAASEQSGPVNKEMRQLLASSKMQNDQLKCEVSRFKQKWKEAVSTIAKVQKELEQERKTKENSVVIPLASATVAAAATAEENDKEMSPEEGKEPGELDESDVEDEATRGKDAEYRITELKKRLRKALKKLCAAQITIDGYRHLGSGNKELVEDFKEAKLENHKLRTYIRNLCRKRSKDGSLEDPSKHTKRLEEQLDRLKKDVTVSKQEEETLLKELEVTGQAFEEIQEQNFRLMQQLKEKDDANFKLMSERIRSNQQQKILKEAISLLEQKNLALQNEHEAQQVVIRDLEEKERSMQQYQFLSEKESNVRYKAMEDNRKKAMESAQMVVDLKFHVEKLTAEAADASQSVLTKTSALEDEKFKIRRMEDEISVLRKRLERLRKVEKGNTADEVLLEEVRSLKEQLTCPSCKVQRKDAVLIKCFHVFCMSCLKTRYETRQRKCPKCNCAFGANDIKRIYIT